MVLFRKRGKKSFEEEQRAKGLIKYGDEWITPAEKYRREQLGSSQPLIRERETIVAKEIVKIKCPYCGTAYNMADHDRCPHCGGK
jgi:rubrerythrin